MYSASVFGLSQIIAEMPYSILCSIVFFLLFCECTLNGSTFSTLILTHPDYPIGFNTSSERAGYACEPTSRPQFSHLLTSRPTDAMILLLELFSVTCGQMVAALMPTR